MIREVPPKVEELVVLVSLPWLDLGVLWQVPPALTAPNPAEIYKFVRAASSVRESGAPGSVPLSLKFHRQPDERAMRSMS